MDICLLYVSLIHDFRFFLVGRESTTSVAIIIASMMMNVICCGSINLAIITFNLAINTLANNLYILPIKLIGVKSLNYLAPLLWNKSYESGIKTTFEYFVFMETLKGQHDVLLLVYPNIS